MDEIEFLFLMFFFSLKSKSVLQIIIIKKNQEICSVILRKMRHSNNK